MGKVPNLWLEEEVDKDAKELIAVPTQGFFLIFFFFLVSVLVLGRKTITCAQKEHTQKIEVVGFVNLAQLDIKDINAFTSLNKTVL